MVEWGEGVDLGLEVNLNEERGYEGGLPMRGRECPRNKAGEVGVEKKTGAYWEG